jgi:RNA polymerase sigma factor (sigma-70 family)
MASGRSGASLGKQLRTLFGVGTLTGLTDAELLDRSLVRDADSSESAFGVLVERHGPMVLGVCRRMLGDGHLAEDAFQATFLILARRGASIRRGSSIGGWLHRVARRTALRARKQADRRRSIENAEVDPDAVAVNLPEPVECRELKSAIDEELDRLNEGQRQAVVLCCIQGMSHEQAAGVLRWPVGTVKSRLGRGREQLRLRLTRRGLAPSVAWPLGTDLAGAKLTAYVPKALADATAKSAFQFVAGSSASGAIASAVATLANGELTTMMLGKWKAIATILISGSAVAGVAGIAVAWSSAALPNDAPKTKTAPKVERKESVSSPTLLSAHGKVVDIQGKPIAGATVYLREWTSLRTQGLRMTEYEPLFRGRSLPDVLAQTRTDAGGRFRFEDVPAPPFSEHQSQIRKSWAASPWDVVATADGHALGWTNFTKQKQKAAFTLMLPEEATIRGRVVEPGGKSVAGAKVQVSAILPLGEDGGGSTTDHSIDLNWSSVPIRAISGPDGRFVIRGLPRHMQMVLSATEAGHEPKFLNAATTDRPQPDVRDQKVHTGDLSIETKPTDHRLVGRVVFETDGKPAAKAEVLWGGMRWRETDAAGRFEFSDVPTGNFELHILARKSGSAPLDLAFEVPDGPKAIEKTFVLPRGLVVRGKVVDEANQAGIGGVELHYQNPQPLQKGRLRMPFGLSTKTEADGTFRIAVPPGRGTLRIPQLPPAYDVPRKLADGGPLSAARLEYGKSREVDGVNGQVLDDVVFALRRGETLTLRVVDLDGRPVPGALLRRRDGNHAFTPPDKADREGRFEVVGVDPNERSTIDVFHPTKNLGARFVSPAASSHDGPTAIDVKLGPLGSAEGKVLDERGEMLPEVKFRLAVNVEHPRIHGLFDSSADAVQPDGSFRFDRLVPGIEYWLDVESPGFARVENLTITPKAGETSTLPDIRLPASDRRLGGVVVDPRGKPIAGASVSVGRDASSGIAFVPSGRHFQNTDSEGRFQLNGLRRGKIEVMAYRRPEPPSHTIKNMIRVEVDAGQTDVRMVLPDANQRLQGIED